MNNIFISSTTQSVVYNEKGLTNLPELPIPNSVKQLYFDENTSTGWIENLDNNGVYVGNTNINTLPEWAVECIAILNTEWDKKYPPRPSPTPIELCKAKAVSLLSQTDWSELPSVTNTANTPHLLNANEFISFRITVRELAVNPIANPEFPLIPTAQWSS